MSTHLPHLEKVENAQVMWVPLTENTRQGRKIYEFLLENQVQNNDKYKVRVI